MNCEWGHLDCQNLSEKCYLCITENAYYKPIKQKKFGLNKTIRVKESKRQGSISEVKAYNQLKDAVDNTTVQGTPNSGAGKIKGDLQIRGLVNAMIENKTTVTKNAKRAVGKESFTIKREWLNKLKREAKEANSELWSLVFSFKEFDDDFYAVFDYEHLIDIIATLKQDRLKAKKVDREIDVYKRRTALVEAENIKLLAEIEYLKSLIENSKTNDDL